MKFQYQFEIIFIRLAVKTDLFTDFRLLLAIDQQKAAPSLKNKYYHSFKLEREQKIINLKQMESFKFIIDQEDRDQEAYKLILRDDQTKQNIQQIHLKTCFIINNYQTVGKTVHDERHEGTYMNVNFKIVVEKKEAGKQEFLLVSQQLSPTHSDQQMKQTLSRTRRPPELNIKKKSQKLRDSVNRNKVRFEDEEALKKTENMKPLFKGLAQEEQTPKGQITVNILEQKKDDDVSRWQPLSAIPDALSAWLRKKVKKSQANEIQEVKELLESHHPVQFVKPTSKLSLKLKIVIAMLIFGVLVLVMDYFKKQTYKFVYGRYPQAMSAKVKQSTKTHKQKQKVGKSGKGTSKTSKAKSGRLK